MNVKPKWDGGPGYPVVREYAEHFIVQDPDCQHQLLALPKSDYEPVPERWVDVTAECEARVHRDELWIFHNDGPHSKNVHCRKEEYRIRLVDVRDACDIYREMTAFIVEKKEA